MGEEEPVDLGRGLTFGVFVQRGRPAGSSGEVTIRYGSVGVWDAGLMVRVTQYSDIDEGRAAAERLAEERGWTSLREASRNNLSDKASAPTGLTSFNQRAERSVEPQSIVSRSCATLDL